MKLGEQAAAIVRLIRGRGNRPGLIADWYASMRAWAEANPGPEARALVSWIELAPSRPFYTATELARFWPALCLATGVELTLRARPSPEQLGRMLIGLGLPRLQNKIGGYYFKSKLTELSSDQYFIVEHVHFWKYVQLSQEELESVLHNH